MLACGEAQHLESVDHIVCLGCGCACDDITLVIRDARIVEARNACSLGAAWFGDGAVPARALVDGHDVAMDHAVEEAARLLSNARSPLVYLAPDVTCEAQRQAVALADLLRAALDTVTSATALSWMLASQERGRASATLGEIRHRADVLVFWGVDPSRRSPRYWTGVAPEPEGLHLGGGRDARTVVAVDVGDWRGPHDADVRVAFAPGEEVAALTWLAASVSGTRARAQGDAGSQQPSGMHEAIAVLSPVLAGARYVALIADGDDSEPGRDAGRAAALVALSHALNGRTRCAMSLLRAGGNRSGADAVLTSQTGYPMAVDFACGYPRYRPYDGTAGARLDRGDVDAVMVIGSPALVPDTVLPAMTHVPCIVCGPRASESVLAGARVVIDTGVAGIHDGGTALRLDDVPLPLRATIEGPALAQDVVRAVRARIGRRP